MKFGLNLSLTPRPADETGAEARRIEEDGFDFISVTDHLHGARPSLESWTFLTWIAASTSRLQLLTNVLGIPYRHPPVLAKMAETLDRLAGGRLILGLGAGGVDAEFHAFGLPVRSPLEKVEALEEAIEILKGLWAELSFTFSGRHFTTNEANIEPKPDRTIPIWLGVYRPKGLRLLGRAADGWIPSLPFAPPEAAVSMMHVIRTAAEGAGRDPDQITYAYNVPIMVGADDRERVLSGQPEELAEKLLALAGKGFNAFSFWILGDTEEQRQRLIGEVIPIVKQA